jgi:hypothetical protein
MYCRSKSSGEAKKYIKNTIDEKRAKEIYSIMFGLTLSVNAKTIQIILAGRQGELSQCNLTEMPRHLTYKSFHVAMESRYKQWIFCSA